MRATGAEFKKKETVAFATAGGAAAVSQAVAKQPKAKPTAVKSGPPKLVPVPLPSSTDKRELQNHLLKEHTAMRIFKASLGEEERKIYDLCNQAWNTRH
jgi:hypothetical protein